MNYTYKGYHGGAAVTGTLEAPTERDAHAQLAARGVAVSDLRLGSAGLLSYQFRTRPSGFQLSAMIAQLGFLQETIGVARSVAVIADIQDNAMLKDALVKASRDVDRGIELSRALRESEPLLGKRVVAMIESGEQSGHLGETCESLAEMIETEAELVAELRSALTYPLTVITFAALVTWFLLTTLVPQFTSILIGLGGELPVPTRIVMAVSAGLSQYGWLLLGALALGLFGLRQYYRTPSGRWHIDTLLLKLPVVGKLWRSSILGRTVRSFGEMKDSGMQIMECLRITADIAQNAPIRAAWLEIGSVVDRGDALSVGFKKFPQFFPAMLVNMVATGEEAGTLETLLKRYAGWESKEAMRGAKALAKLVEPLLIIVLGLLVGFIVLSVMLPYFQIIGQLGKT